MKKREIIDKEGMCQFQRKFLQFDWIKDLYTPRKSPMIMIFKSPKNSQPGTLFSKCFPLKFLYREGEETKLNSEKKVWAKACHLICFQTKHYILPSVCGTLYSPPNNSWCKASSVMLNLLNLYHLLYSPTVLLRR